MFSSIRSALKLRAKPESVVPHLEELGMKASKMDSLFREQLISQIERDSGADGHFDTRSTAIEFYQWRLFEHLEEIDRKQVISAAASQSIPILKMWVEASPHLKRVANPMVGAFAAALLENDGHGDNE